MDIIYGVSVMGGGEDNMCWQPAKSRGFEVSSYYQVFNTAELGTIVFTLFGVHWVMPNTVVDLLAW